MGRYILGIIMIVVGAFLVVKTEWMLRAFGRVAWAEEKLGLEGGTRIFYKLLGLAGIILAFMIMTGSLQRFIVSIFVR